MRVLHLEASTGWGGQELRILEEAKGMRALGHEVVLGVMHGGQLVERAKGAGFVVHELNFRKSGWLKCLWQLVWILRDVDVVNTHSSLDAWIGGIAARLAGRPVVRTRHLSGAIRSGWNSRILYGKLADFVVTTCSSVIPMIAQQSGKRLELCRCIATGIDPKTVAYRAEEAAEFRKSLGVRLSDFLVGTVCVMRSWKGLFDLLEAAHRLRDVTDLQWVIVGGGHEEVYRNRAQELQLEGIVHFTGHLDRPFAAMGALDAFALLSTANEGISQALLQAAYLKKPLLATPVGGSPEVCIDRMTGFQVAPHAPEEVAQRVLELKASPALREEFGQRGHEWVKERFTLQRTVAEMVAVMEGLGCGL